MAMVKYYFNKWGVDHKPPITPPPSGGMPIYRESWIDKVLMGIVYFGFAFGIMTVLSVAIYLLVKFLEAFHINFVTG